MQSLLQCGVLAAGPLNIRALRTELLKTRLGCLGFLFKIKDVDQFFVETSQLVDYLWEGYRPLLATSFT